MREVMTIPPTHILHMEDRLKGSPMYMALMPLSPITLPMDIKSAQRCKVIPLQNAQKNPPPAFAEPPLV